MKRIAPTLVLCVSLAILLSGCGGTNRTLPADQLVVIPSDLPEWGHIPLHDQAGALTPPLDGCVDSQPTLRPVYTGEAFSYSNDSIHTFLLQSSDETQGKRRLDHLRSQAYRDCVKTAFEKSEATQKADVAALELQNHEHDVSAISIKQGGYETYIVTVTNGRNEVLIEGSADNSVPVINEKLMSNLTKKVRTRLSAT